MLQTSLLLVSVLCGIASGLETSTTVFATAVANSTGRHEATSQKNSKVVSTAFTAAEERGKPSRGSADTKLDQCNEHITEGTNFGFISTPNYPQLYDNNVTCLWLLVVRPGHHLRVMFKDFHLENDLSDKESKTPKCPFDFLRIFELYKARQTLPYGSASHYVVLQRNWGTYCGSDKPPEMTLDLPGSTLHLYFYADGSTPAKGFLFTFEHVRNARITNRASPNDTHWGEDVGEHQNGKLSVNYLLFAFLLVFLGVSAVAGVAYRIAISNVVDSLGTFSDRFVDQESGQVIYETDTGIFATRPSNFQGGTGTNRIPTPPPAYGDIVKTEEEWNRVIQQLGEASATALRQRLDAESIEVTYDLSEDFMTNATMPSTTQTNSGTFTISTISDFRTLRLSSSDDPTPSDSIDRTIDASNSGDSSFATRSGTHLTICSAPDPTTRSEFELDSSSAADLTSRSAVEIRGSEAEYESASSMNDASDSTPSNEDLESGERESESRTLPLLKIIFRSR